jgi:ribosomal protein L11 methyltransferase
MRAFRVLVAEADEEPASFALWEAGTTGIEVRPASPGRVELIAYFADGATPPSPIVIHSRPDPGTVNSRPDPVVLEPVDVPDVDWVARFREGFRRFRAGRFEIAPVWEAPSPSPDLLVVDPGRAFGTGTHETTRLCLGALEELAVRRPLGRALDLGAGTGLLAIAAARLGASPVVATDIDPEATASSRLHARLNGTPLRVVRCDGAHGLRAGSFDLVLANLMALFLVDRAREIQALVAPGGALVLSGLLTGDVDFVRRAFEGCGPARERVDGEWAALVYERER